MGFSWTITLEDAANNPVGEASGSGIWGGGGVGHVDYNWENPPIPPQGVRPYITVSGVCDQVKKVGFCTGIHYIAIPHPIRGDSLGPLLPTCSSCYRVCHVS